MKSSAISDQKRLVRAEHWLFARSFLRARDAVHNAKWRLLTIAGPDPAEEITCIRELMPKALITAIDIDQQNLLASIVAGANKVVCHDIFEFDEAPARNRMGNSPIPSSKLGGPFDVVCLDLTGPASAELVQAVKVYFKALVKGGALIVTFSYGRDVTEFYAHHWRLGRGLYLQEREAIASLKMPDRIRERMWFLLGSRIKSVRSVMQYRGGAMPMISVLLTKDPRPQPAAQFTSIEPGDYEVAVTSESLGNVYACPADRIEALRRSAVAKRAVLTRKLRVAAEQPSGDSKLL